MTTDKIIQKKSFRSFSTSTEKLQQWPNTANTKLAMTTTDDNRHHKIEHRCNS